MLATAFLKGFTGVDSQLLEEGYCVAAFMNVPRSEAWEPNLNLEASVRMLGQIPKHKLVYASDITEPPFELITFF